MRLSISGRVVKSYDVEVSTPRMVECNEGFQQLDAYLTVLSVGEEDLGNSENLEHPGLMATSFETEAKEKAAMILAEAEITALRRSVLRPKLTWISCVKRLSKARRLRFTPARRRLKDIKQDFKREKQRENA